MKLKCVLVSGLDPFLKDLEINWIVSLRTFMEGLEMKLCLVPFLSMVLKEGALLTSCSVSWEETFFLPDLPMVLKEVSLPLILTMSSTLLSIILFTDDSYAIYTNGLERSWFVSVFLFLSSAWCIFGWSLERSLSACPHSHGLERSGWIVMKGLRCNSLVLPVVFCHLFSSNGLERNLWSWCLSHFL